MSAPIPEAFARGVQARAEGLDLTFLPRSIKAADFEAYSAGWTGEDDRLMRDAIDEAGRASPGWRTDR